MSDKVQRISRLIAQQLNGSLDDSEQQELNDWLALSDDNQKWYEQVTNKFYLPRRLKEYEVAESLREGGWDKIVTAKKARIVLISRRMAVAAAVLIACSVSAVYWFNRQHKAGNPVASVAQQYKNDMPPGGGKAVLTLGNGTQIVLNDAKNGALAQQGKVNVEKLDSGLITYNLAQGNNPRGTLKVVWNTLATPRGGQYKVVLADGSKVWLNAASSLRFPSSFSGKTRQVLLTGGEAYFEVAKNKNIPFIVVLPAASGAKAPLGGRSRGAEIEVLGTHFDVMAYEDEKMVRATLLEGSIKVKNGTGAQVLSPGQRAQLGADGSMKVIDDADAEGSIAWINGNFQFKKDDIESVMRQLARWYDVEVTYEGKKTTQSFSGVISRDNNASDVLKALEVSEVHFRIEGRKIIVLP